MRIWTSILQGTCSYILELDVRLLNHPNWTSITQIIVRFPRLLQIRLLMIVSKFLPQLVYDYSISLLEFSDILG